MGAYWSHSCWLSTFDLCNDENMGEWRLAVIELGSVILGLIKLAVVDLLDEGLRDL